MNFGLGIILLLVLLSGVFSASEIALTSLSRAKVLSMKEEGEFGSAAVDRLKKTPQRVLVSILVGNQAVNTIATFLATIWAINVFGETGVNIFIFAFTLILIIVGSILPKTFALGFPDIFSRFIAYPMLGFVFITRPLIYLFEAMINGFTKLLGIDPKQLSKTSDKEIEAMIDIGASEGVIEEGQDVFLKHVLKFGETKVEEVMTPLKEIAILNTNIERDELIDFLDENNHSEFPVYKNDLNSIKGTISLHDLMQILRVSKNKHPLAGKSLSQVVVIPKTATFIQLFKVLNEEKKRMAIVIDEYGQTTGLVTMANIMQEITGINTSRDKKSEPVIKKKEKNLWEVDGDVRIKQVNDELGITLPYPEHQVMSLVVLEELKRFPENNEEIKIDGLLIKIKQIKKNVVKKLELSKTRKSKSTDKK